MAGPEIPEPLVDREHRTAYTQRMAASLLFALIAERQYYNPAVLARSTQALGLSIGDTNDAQDALVEGGRVTGSAVDGLVPTAGAFPPTFLEHHIATELVVPIAEQLDELDRVGATVGSEIRHYVADQFPSAEELVP